MRWITNWFKRSFSLENPSTPLDGSTVGESFPGESIFWGTSGTVSKVNVTHDTALTFSAVFACINVLSSAQASLPLRVLKRTPQGGKSPSPEHPVDYLIHCEANDEMPSQVFRQNLMSYTLRYGNGYAWIEREDGINPSALYLIPSDLVTIKRINIDGVSVKYYHVQGFGNVLPENMIHIRGIGDIDEGYSPIRLFREGIGLGLALETFGSSLFGNGANFRGLIQVAKKLSPEAYKEKRQQIDVTYSGPSNGNKLGILHDGDTYVPTSMNADDAQFLASRTFQLQEIARVFNVPNHKIGDLSAATFSNIEESNMEFYTASVMPWNLLVEAEFSKKLFFKSERANYSIEHNYNAMLRGKQLERAQFYQIMRTTGAYTINDILDHENMNPIDIGGDDHVVPLNMTTVEAMAANPPKPIDQSSQQSASSTPTPTAYANDTAKNAMRGVLVDAIGRMVRRECTALRRLIKKPEPTTAIEEFYADHRSITAEAIAPAVNAWSSLVGTNLDGAGFIEGWIRDASGDVLRALGTPDGAEALIGEWESSKTNQLIDRIMEAN